MVPGGFQDQDQELANFDVPVIDKQLYEFNAEIPPPDLSLLRGLNDVFDCSAITLQANFNGQEFFRCSFFVRHYYPNNEEDRSYFDASALRRRLISTNEDSVIHRNIDWFEVDGASIFTDQMKGSIQEARAGTIEIMRGFPNAFEVPQDFLFDEGNLEFLANSQLQNTQDSLNHFKNASGRNIHDRGVDYYVQYGQDYVQGGEKPEEFVNIDQNDFV